MNPEKFDIDVPDDPRFPIQVDILGRRISLGWQEGMRGGYHNTEFDPEHARQLAQALETAADLLDPPETDVWAFEIEMDEGEHANGAFLVVVMIDSPDGLRADVTMRGNEHVLFSAAQRGIAEARANQKEGEES